MTPEQVDIVQRTAALVARDGDRFARAFYDHLFERRPSARCLFPEEMDLQRSRLVEEILLLVAAAADLPSFLQRARELGRRHQGYGVHADDYAFVGDALVAAVAVVAAAEWSPERRGGVAADLRPDLRGDARGRASRAVHRPRLKPGPPAARARRGVTTAGSSSPRSRSARSIAASPAALSPAARAASTRSSAASAASSGEPSRSNVSTASRSRPRSVAAMPAACSARAAARSPCTDPASSTRRSTTAAARPNRTASCSSMTSSAKAPRGARVGRARAQHLEGGVGPTPLGGQPPEGAVAIAPEQPVVVGPELRHALDVAPAALGVATQESRHAHE